MTHILVVEDEASFSDALSFMLRKEGFDVSVAADGHAALVTYCGAVAGVGGAQVHPTPFGTGRDNHEWTRIDTNDWVAALAWIDFHHSCELVSIRGLGL